MQRSIRSWGVCIAILFTLGLWTLPVSASPYGEELAGGTSGVDVFILIDQSLSMSGFNGQPANDPNDLRIDTACYLVDYLNYQAIIDRGTSYRIGVIGFGSPAQSRVMVDLATIGADSSSSADEVETIKSKIVAEKLGDTNIVSALDLVSKQLLTTDGAGTERKRVLIVLTDGTPYDSSHKLTLGGYFKEIRAKYSELQKQHPGPWSQLVVGIDAQNNYWPYAEPEWRRLTPLAHQVQESAAMKTELVQMLAPELGSQGRTFESGGVIVEPYLDWVTFSIFKYTQEPVVISYPDGKGGLLELRNDDRDLVSSYQAGERYELWMIKNPTPGTWKIESRGTGKVDIFKQIHFGAAKMAYPETARAVNLPFYLRFSFANLASYATQYPLSTEVSIAGPGLDTAGVLLPCCKQLDAGVFATLEPYVPRASGPYRVHLRATTTIQASDGLKEVVVAENEFSFSAYEPVIEIASPPPPYLQYEPVTGITFDIKDPQNQLVDEDVAVPLMAELSVSLPGQATSSIRLERSESGRYTASEAVALPGEGPKGLEPSVRDEQGNVLFRKMQQVSTFADLRLVSPSATVPLSGSLSLLAVALYDATGKAFVPAADENRKLELHAIILPPSGDPTGVVLIYDEATGTFRARTPIPSTSEGTHRIHIVGQARSNGSELTTFENELNYTVTSDLPYYRVLSPRPDEVSELHIGLRAADLPVSIQWLQGGKPVDPQTVFLKDSSNLLDVEVSGPVGVQPARVGLAPASDDDRSIWVADVAGLKREGTYTVTFGFPATSLVGHEPYTGFDPVQVSFRRTEPLLWRLWLLFWGFIASIVAGLALWRIGFEVCERFIGPFPKGVVTVFEYEAGRDVRVQITQRNLFQGRRRTIQWSPREEKVRALGIAKIVIRRIPGLRSDQAEGISLEVFSPKGDRIFAHTLNRGIAEMRIPVQNARPGMIYRLHYEPPCGTRRASIS